jgi:uncharacterized protein (DUF2141 family)
MSNVCLSQFKLNIEIVEIRNDSGKIMLQLFDENEKVVNQMIGPIQEKRSLFTFEDLKTGRYAVRYYHDENMNAKMETNLLGKPTEGYGFSNNVVGKLGAPPFKKWLFEVTRDQKIVLKPTY